MLLSAIFHERFLFFPPLEDFALHSFVKLNVQPNKMFIRFHGMLGPWPEDTARASLATKIDSHGLKSPMTSSLFVVFVSSYDVERAMIKTRAGEDSTRYIHSHEIYASKKICITTEYSWILRDSQISRFLNSWILRLLNIYNCQMYVNHNIYSRTSLKISETFYSSLLRKSFLCVFSWILKIWYSLTILYRILYLHIFNLNFLIILLIEIYKCF